MTTEMEARTAGTVEYRGRHRAPAQAGALGGGSGLQELANGGQNLDRSLLEHHVSAVDVDKGHV